MLDLALILVGLWLLFSIVHGEFRRREVELRRARQRRQLAVANARAAEIRAEIDAEDAGEASAPPEVDGPHDPLATLPADPTGAQIAEVVVPRPEEEGVELLGEVRQVVRENPDLAATAIQRLIAQDREREPA